jgi:hypothetical protein
MIISCPECAGPFEVPDDRIAALVQVACPHCAFRMILDFAAANDPGLVEQGMRMASGFRSSADYHASVQLAAAPVEAEPVAAEATTGEPAAPPLELVPAQPEPAPRTQPAARVQPAVRTEPPVRPRAEPPVRSEPPPVRARPEPVSPAAASPRPLSPTPAREPVRPAAEVRSEASEEARTEVHMLPRGEKRVPIDIPPRGRPPSRDSEDIAVSVPAPATEIVRTVVGPPPTPPAPDEVAIDMDDDEGEAPQRPTATAADHAAHPAFGDDEDEDVPTMVVGPEAREAAQREMEAIAARRARPEPEAVASRERPRPPHTPPGHAKPTARDEEATAVVGERPGRRPPVEPAIPGRNVPEAISEPIPVEDEDDAEQERMSTFGVVVVVILLVLTLGIVGASMLHNKYSPDPRPLLELMYRQYVKGETPAAKAEAPAKDDAKSDAKSDAPAKAEDAPAAKGEPAPAK